MKRNTKKSSNKAPKMNVQFALLIGKFNHMRRIGYASKQIQKSFLNDEIFALALWYAAKYDENTEGDTHYPPTREERMIGIAEGIMEIKADMRGEKEMKTLSQLIQEIKENV
jgi:hypothetical protein